MQFNWQIIAEIVPLVGLVVAVTALVYQVRGVKNQIKIGVFTEYTKRYANARRGMRSEWRTAVDRPLSADDFSSEDKDRLFSAMRDYFNLCSEELFLHKQGWIDEAAWKIWQAGMRECKREPYFIYCWNGLHQEYTFFDDFCNFMENGVIAWNSTTGLNESRVAAHTQCLR